MTNNEDSFEEWLEGFASAPYTSHQLDEIKARAESVSAVEVKHLVNEIELLRSLLKSLLDYSENLEKDSERKDARSKKQTQLFELARFMLSGRV